MTENDGSEVTIPVDGDTQVMGKPGEETSLSDLEAGQQVSVSAPDGDAARAIMVMPKKGDFPAGFKGGPMGPPPGPPPRWMNGRAQATRARERGGENRAYPCLSLL